MDHEEHALGDWANYPESGEAYCLVNRDRRVMGFNASDPSWGFPDGRKPDHSPGGIVKLTNDDRISKAIGQVFAGEAAIDLRINFPSEDGAKGSVSVQLRRLTTEDGPLALLMLRRVFDHPTAAIAHDPLTGLPDRRALAPCVDQWRLAAGSNCRFAVVFLDLDKFKEVNDSHGHAAGDQVLKEIAKCWNASIRDDDLLVRYGGDEFVLLINGASSPDEVFPVLRRMHEAVKNAANHGAIPLYVGASFGIAFFDDAASTIDELIAAADRDMYSRKRYAARIMPG